MDFSSAEQGLEKSEAVGTQAASSGVCTAQLFANSAMSSVCSPTAWKEHPEKKVVNTITKGILEISESFKIY